MKKLMLLIATLLLVFALTACEDLCVGAECIVQDPSGETPATTELPKNLIPFVHVNGEGHQTDKLAYVLLEYKLRDYVKYQVTYLSCTCRPGDYNYWNVAFIEINTNTNDIIIKHTIKCFYNKVSRFSFTWIYL